MTQGSKRRTQERVLVIFALVLWICFGFRTLDFGFPAHAGTRVFFTTSSTTPRAVWPEKRAWGSIISR